jgi:hypothetical protein
MNADEYRRWRDADENGREDEADRAFGAVFRTVAAEPPPSTGFTARTVAAVAAVAERDARRARRTRRAVAVAAGVGGIVAAYYGSGWAVSLLASAFIGFINVLVATVIGGAAGLEAGASVWGVIGNLGRAAGAFVADPKVTVAIIAIQVIAMGALRALQRLLGSDGESFE